MLPLVRGGLAAEASQACEHVCFALLRQRAAMFAVDFSNELRLCVSRDDKRQK